MLREIERINEDIKNFKNENLELFNRKCDKNEFLEIKSKLI